MADFLCDLDLGTGDDDGSSWANAFKTLQAAFTGASAGDRIFVQGSETNATTQTLTSTGTPANPLIVIGVKEGTTNDPVEAADVVDDRNDANMPSFTVSNAGADLKWSNPSHTYFWGIKFDIKDALDRSAVCSFIFEQCHLLFNRNFAGSSSGSAVITFLDCKLEYTGTSTMIQNSGSLFRWEGGELVGTPSTLYVNLTTYSAARFVGVDLSSMGSGDLTDWITRPSNVQFIGCKLGTSFVVEDDVGDLVDWSSGVEVHLSDSGTGITNPITTFFERSHMGAVRDETTVVRLAGASDGTTPWSYKLTVSDNVVVEGFISLKTPKLIGWVGSAGTSQTFDVFIHNTTGDFDDDEVWLELYIPSNDSAQMARSTTLPAPVATVAAITDDTSTWNGSANFSQRLRITATPDHEGPVFGYVHFAKRGTSIEDLYVDPQIVIANA